MTSIASRYCHAPRATTVLERALIAGRTGLLCPECSGLVFLESATPDPSLSLEVDCTERTHA